MYVLTVHRRGIEIDTCVTASGWIAFKKPHWANGSSGFNVPDSGTPMSKQLR